MWFLKKMRFQFWRRKSLKSTVQSTFFLCIKIEYQVVQGLRARGTCTLYVSMLQVLKHLQPWDSFICDHWRQFNVLLTQLLIALPVNAVTNLRSNCVYTIVQTLKKSLTVWKIIIRLIKNKKQTQFLDRSPRAHLNKKY